VLRALWHLQLRGDQDDAPVAQRSWYQEVLDEADPAVKLSLNARNGRAVKERAGALLGVIRNAAMVDADISELWKRISADFHGNQRAIVTSLEAQGALRPGLGVDQAADILWALNHPDLWHLLVGERRWTPEDWERWFCEASCRELLAARCSALDAPFVPDATFTAPHGQAAVAMVRSACASLASAPLLDRADCCEADPPSRCGSGPPDHRLPPRNQRERRHVPAAVSATRSTQRPLFSRLGTRNS
jgi:hypothetical protein